jgi:hypothetical protein
MKKALERWQLEQLRAVDPAFPSGTVEECEAPDFLIHTHRGVLGIEVTGLYPAGSDLRRAEGEWEQLIQAARALYEAAGHPPVRVGVWWEVGDSRTAGTRESRAQALADTVAALCPTPGGSRHVEYSGQGGVALPRGVESLRVDRRSIPPESFWFFGQGGVVPVWSPRDLQAAIDAKEAKLGTYLTRCDEAWLLLLANHSYASSWGEHSPASRDHVYTCAFSRVVVHRMLPTELVELRLRPPSV